MSSLGESDDGEVLEQIASLARRRVLVEFERCELAGDLEDWVGPWFGDEALRERLARHVADGRGVARLRNFLDAAVADELHDELAVLSEVLANATAERSPFSLPIYTGNADVLWTLGPFVVTCNL